MKYNFDEIIDRDNTNSEKWNAKDLILKFGLADRFDEDTIPLFVADMDFAVPQPVLDALKNRVDQKMFGYTVYSSDTKYEDAIVSWFNRRFAWQINPGERNCGRRNNSRT